MLRDRLRPAARLVRSLVGTNGLAAQVSLVEARLDALAHALRATHQPASPRPEPLLPPPSAPPVDMSLLLHRGRSALLREVPKGAAVFLSAGCAGGWFFDWVQDCYGTLPRHIGLEFYTPRPERLPDNVEWISNTCSDMSGVADAACDIVFSGQNLEHLWPDESRGFLLEAARVTRPGGLLVMDSPNRAITAALRTWSHPEHTVELTTAEAVEVTELAGFDVAAVKGIWLTRDPASGAVLPFQYADGQKLSLEERLMMAVARPEDAFLWWIEARRSARAPDEPGLRGRLDDIFRQAWPERMTRMSIGIGQVEAGPQGEEWVACPAGATGVVVFGPYAPLRAGRYRCTFRLEGVAPARGRCDVAVGEDGRVLLSEDVEIGPSRIEVSLEFELAALQFGVQFRCFSLDGGAFRCLRAVALEQLEDDRR